ncbi:ATP12 family chaperone protein [Pelagibacterium limicola]|uniref:ATP12 family chaperone protein n=1 Tax=Pelagibacterium limicola TaxID=2791022 RepID=UPI0018AF93CE|nr:ATP12 family protein [Pelagibacterium limicola]
MREFLEDALNHRDDGYGRAQKHMQRELPKRFYKIVAVAQVGSGYTVTLDGRQIKTPTKKAVTVASRELAETMRTEWDGQGTHVDPDLMPHVRLVNSAIEGGEEAREALIDEVVKYAANDLLLYRADSPRELAALQEDVWDSVLVKIARHFSVSFRPTVGILHQEQPVETQEKLKISLASVDFMSAAALVSMTGIMGSGLLTIAMLEGLIDPETAWRAAHVDEDYQIAHWGEDFEAAKRREKRKIEFDAAVNVMRWLAG